MIVASCGSQWTSLCDHSDRWLSLTWRVLIAACVFEESVWTNHGPDAHSVHRRHPRVPLHHVFERHGGGLLRVCLSLDAEVFGYLQLLHSGRRHDSEPGSPTDTKTSSGGVAKTVYIKCLFIIKKLQVFYDICRM